MRTVDVLKLLTLVVLATGSTPLVAAQEPQPATREAVIEQAQAEKAKELQPYVPGKAERLMNEVQELLIEGRLHWYPFFQSAYAGGGFTLGAGYSRHVSPYNLIDVRGSFTFSGYKRAEAEFVAPRLFNRHASLSILGGWREATQVGFYGLGMATSKDDRTSFGFKQPYGSGRLTCWPTRRLLFVGGGTELSRWSQQSGEGRFPSVETVFPPDSLAGLGSEVTYLHSEASAGLDWRTSPGYSRRGGYYAVTFHDFADRDDAFGFTRVDYEAIQHFPILREAWVISLHALAQMANDKSGEQIPFYMLPTLGSGSTLRGFASQRFRDRNSLLLQAEWRIMVNRFFDTAFFYDAGKIAARSSDLDLKGLKSNFGFGVRFHGPSATPLRVELARGNEGLNIVFAASQVF